jgi:hypothetical protein
MSEPDINFHDLTFQEQLEAFAVFNIKAEIVKNEDSEILIEIKLKYEGAKKALAKVLKPRETKKIQLTGLALVVFRKLVDEKYNIRDLIYWLQNNYKLSFFEARNLIVQFTGELMKKGVIVIEK